MITLNVNGKLTQVPSSSSLSTVVTALTGRQLTPDGNAEDGGRIGFAIAVNTVVVPRKGWAAWTVSNGDEVEILTAVQGG